MNRRDFLKGSVFAGSAGLVLEACAPESSQVIPILIPEEEFTPGVEEWLATTCLECPGGCGLLTRKIDGRLVKVEGNPKHPVSRGGSCARAQALPQALYHPDRLRKPLAREGERGTGRWREISWDEALGRLVSELGRLRQDERTRSLAILTGNWRGHRRDLIRRFLDAFGSPYHLVHEPFGDRAVAAATRLTTGVDSFFALDLEESRYLLVFGAALLDASRSPVRFGRGVGRFRQGRPGIRGKLVVVEPRLSLTAANADEWLPARPGTEAAVALGLARVLVDEGLYDRRFVQEKTKGFDLFREQILSRFTPEAAAEMAGLKAESLKRIAREIGANRPAVAVAGDAAAAAPEGLAAALAVSHLNAILGSFGVPGGIYFDPEPPFAPWPPLPRDPRAERARSSYQASQPLATVAPSLAGGELSLEVLLVAGTNPLHSLPVSFGLREALARIPFIASFATILDETSDLADLVLPEPTIFERFDDDVPSPALGFPAASLSGPLLARPLFDVRSMPDAILQIAARLGGSIAEAFPWKTYEQALRAAWAGLEKAEPESTFWKKALAQGGWWDESAPRTADFRTPDRRYIFEVGPLQSLATAPRAAQEQFPLVLHVYASAAFGDGRSAHLPFLQELGDPMTGVRWGTVVEIHPRTAAERSIREGEVVEVASTHGTLAAPARLTQAIRPDVVAVAAGQGHTRYGRYAQGRGANPFQLLGPAVEPASGEVAIAGTQVQVRKAT